MLQQMFLRNIDLDDTTKYNAIDIPTIIQFFLTLALASNNTLDNTKIIHVWTVHTLCFC